ncbi:hypothetical protein BWI97_21220 [Siphonobacter sp. BAB-5405]|uniref:hypothetical protein n=1 Tax=Siphonobacter sp. BAB-5405 TaxID=1864825 RepID=UPI000C8013D5|nr:hypothetical protein [Siphonobacter sp. BAB-5405]PMD91638.1 hypothetical protein BWI97_21220 [Siphonobacter sp. BAB-5405]
MIEYEDIQTGALRLLYDTCSLLNELNVKYIIVGGWAPFLLNSKPIEHPGTKDVDVLFDGAYEKGKLKEVIDAFLENEFILSAKHDFQLFKLINVLGREFIYNIDLLHPLETTNPQNLYVEHIDLKIPANKYRRRNFMMKSIALPSSQILFDNDIFFNYNLKITAQDGIELNQNVPLMGELGTLITKSSSVSVKKRYRDSLDIFLTISQSTDLTALINSTNRLRKSSIMDYNTLYNIKQAFDDDLLWNNTLKFIPELNKSEFICVFESFFKNTGLDKKATS